MQPHGRRHIRSGSGPTGHRALRGTRILLAAICAVLWLVPASAVAADLSSVTERVSGAADSAGGGSRDSADSGSAGSDSASGRGSESRDQADGSAAERGSEVRDAAGGSAVERGSEVRNAASEAASGGGSESRDQADDAAAARGSELRQAAEDVRETASGSRDVPQAETIRRAEESESTIANPVDSAGSQLPASRLPAPDDLPAPGPGRLDDVVPQVQLDRAPPAEPSIPALPGDLTSATEALEPALEAVPPQPNELAPAQPPDLAIGDAGEAIDDIAGAAPLSPPTETAERLAAAVTGPAASPPASPVGPLLDDGFETSRPCLRRPRSSTRRPATHPLPPPPCRTGHPRGCRRPSRRRPARIPSPASCPPRSRTPRTPPDRRRA